MRLFEQYKGLRKEIYVLFICKLIDNMGSMIGPMLTLILSINLGYSAKQIAIISTILTIASLPVGLIGGKIADKFNKKLILNIGDISTSIIYIACGIIGINNITIAAYFAGSLIQAAESATYSSLVADFSIGEQREKASSLLYLGLNLGMVLAPTIGGFLLKEHANLIFLLNGVFQLLSIIIFDIFVKDTTAIVDTENKYENKSESTNAFVILKENKILTYTMIIIAISCAIYGMWGYLMPLTLSDINPDFGSIYYGTMSSLNCVVVVLFTVLVTSLFEKKTSINKMILGNIFEISGFAIFALFVNTPFMYYVAIVVFTIGEIINTISTSPHITKRIPMNYRGRILSLSDGLYFFFYSIISYITGFIYDSYGMSLSWITVILIGIGTIISYILLKKPDEKSYPDLYK